MSIKTLLEQRQVERKYNLSDSELEKLVKSFGADYCAEVMIELGHDNDEIQHWTNLGKCRINWMRCKYEIPTPKADLEFAYRENNKDFVHVLSKKELMFYKLFQCGIYHKEHKQQLARVNEVIWDETSKQWIPNATRC